MSLNVNIQLPDGQTASVVREMLPTASVAQSTSNSVTVSSAVIQTNGADGDKHYAHAFTNLSWSTVGSDKEQTITHNLGKYPAVTVIDNFDRVLIVEVDYIDNNTVKLTSSGAFSGKAYFN